jgi:hypothetical protein
MFVSHRSILVGLTAATLLAAGTEVGTAIAREGMHRSDKVSMGEEKIKKLLPLMDQDKDGQVSRQAFMKYMEAAFERLDKEKSGHLSVRGLTQQENRPASFSAAGK